MNIFIIYKEDYPWDVRVEKIAKTLHKQGNAVSIISSNRSQNCTEEKIDDLNIKRLPNTSSWPKIIQQLVNLPLWFNPFWIYTILKSMKGLPDRVIIIRDLPLMLTGIICGRILKAKVIFDMAECYPEMYASGTNKTLATKIAKNKTLALIYEKFCVKYSDLIWVMIEESRDRLIKMGVNPNKISIVSNTPPPEKHKNLPRNHTGESLHILYVGFVTEIRGLDLLVNAVHEFKKKHPNAEIQADIVGVGSATEHIQDLIHQHKLHEYVRVHGWLEYEEITKLFEIANVGALTYQVCPHWNHTIPNKIFDYMIEGLPVLATEVVPISRILIDTQSGLVGKDRYPEDIANKLSMLMDSELRNKLGSNGQKAIRDQYNWSIEEQRIKDDIDRLMLS